MKAHTRMLTPNTPRIWVWSENNRGNNRVGEKTTTVHLLGYTRWQTRAGVENFALLNEIPPQVRAVLLGRAAKHHREGTAGRQSRVSTDPSTDPISIPAGSTRGLRHIPQLCEHDIAARSCQSIARYGNLP